MDMFNKRQLVISGDKTENRSARSACFKASLDTITVPPLSDAARAGFNVRLPRIYEALLRTDKSLYVESIGAEDVHNLPEIGIQLALSDTSPKVAFRVVFGATEQMPLRAIGYLLPALLTMERLREADGSVPQLQVVFAHQISSRLNRLDSKRVFEQSSQFAQVAKAYIQDFFPEFENSAVFLEDASLKKGTPLREELIFLARNLVHLSPELREALDAKGNGNRRLNAYYAAAHLLMHDRDSSEYLRPVISEQPDYLINPSSIVSFGGLQESLFYSIRHDIKQHLGQNYNSVNTAQYFTRHHVPPYYMARGGDIRLVAK